MEPNLCFLLRYYYTCSSPKKTQTDLGMTHFPFADHQNQQFLRKIDVNSLPSTVECEEETGVSSPNSTISSTVSGKRRSGREDDLDIITLDRSSSRGTSDEEEDYGGEACRKKLRLSKDQSAVLEDTFKEHNTLNPVSHSLREWRVFLSITLWRFNEGFIVNLAETEAGFG